MINSAIATVAFDAAGLGAMGPASGQMASRWADSTPTLDETAMTLSLAGASSWHAVAGGVVIWSRGAAGLSDAVGSAIDDDVAVLRFHPQAVLRIRRLAALRFDGGGSVPTRPLPVAAAIRGGEAPAELAGLQPGERLPPDLVAPGDPIAGGTISFHDDRGLIIDPVAVACVLRDLMRGFPPLLGAGAEADLTNADGGTIATAAGLVTGRHVQLVDLFGRPWTQAPGRGGIRLGASGPLGTGPHAWGTETLEATGAGTIRFGLTPNGTLATTPLAAPALATAGVPAPSLPREFLRVAVVDVALHLRGNRGQTGIDGVPGADAATAAEPPPPVASGAIDALPNGQATLGAVATVARLAGERLVVSPTIATDFDVPADRDERWPAAPAPAGAAEDLIGAIASRARAEAAAAYAGDTADVVVSWPAGALPGEAFVRVFPRVDPGRAVVPLAQLAFSRRGDGAAGIANSATGLILLIDDPFGVGDGPRPDAPTLIFDLLILTRGPGGQVARLFGSVEADVTTGGVAPAIVPVTNELGAIPADRRGICPAPLLGFEPSAPAAGTNPVLGAFGEAAPRESPRFWTMARTDTLVAGHDGADPGTWTSVLTPGILDARSLRGDARLGSPGLPAGPEEHASGVVVTGALAQLTARAALRRTAHLARRLPELDDDRWEPLPADDGTVSGAVLQSVADTVESPELRAAVPAASAADLPGTWAALIATIGPTLPPSLSSLLGSLPAPGAGDRWVEEVRREAMAAHHGRRDSQWSWRWAISHARRLVYVETSLLAATAHGTAPHEVDLVALLSERLQQEKSLRLILALPKRMPLGPGYEPFAQRLHLARNAAVAALRAAGGARVVAYHPIGFPGRPEQLRGTLAVVDDVWALAGSSTLSRRGLTFDGGLDVSFFGHDLDEGVSRAARDLRRNAMARLLGLSAPPAGAGETPDPRWVRLADPHSAFELLRETLNHGGEGELEGLWPGLPEADLPALDATIADPDGRDVPTMLAAFAAALAALGPNGL